MGLTSCYKFKHIFHHIPGAIFAHVSIYLGQLVIFFCHDGTKLSFSRLSDGEPFLYCNNMFGLLLFKAYQFFKRIQRILKKLFKKIIFPVNILCTIQCKLPSFYTAPALQSWRVVYWFQLVCMCMCPSQKMSSHHFNFCAVL